MPYGDRKPAQAVLDPARRTRIPPNSLGLGTPGDWTRGVRHLTEHVGPARARRMCQTWHIEVTGVATGSRLNPGNNR